MDQSGNESSKVSISDADAKTNTLTNFFSGIEQAVNDLIAGDTTSDRGTLLTISVAPTGMTVAALGGNVTFTDSNGNVSTIDVGTGLVLNADGTQSTETLASLIAQEKETGTSGNNNSLTAALADAVKTVSDRVAAGTDGNAGVAQLAALIKVVSAANPSEAASYVSTAVAAATSSTSGITDKVNALAAISEAAAGSLSGANLLAMQNAAMQAATANGMSNITAFNASRTVTQTGSDNTDISTILDPIDNIVISPSS